MKLMSYEVDGAWQAAIGTGDRFVDARAAGRAAGWNGDTADALRSTRGLLGLDRDRLAELAAVDGEATLDLGSLRVGPPVWDPQKIVCLGLNYSDHAAESGLEPPKAPMWFAKFANSLIGPRDAIVPPRTTGKVDYEAELAVVIGRRGRNIDVADALAEVAGAMAFNDVSARDLQLANPLWTGGKAVDTFAPCGPALVLMDELADLQDLGLRTRVNGKTVQDGSTSKMIFGVRETVAFLSTIMTLEPGDIIATGTPAGVGQARDPQLFLGTGDVVEVEVDRIGTLTNTVAQPV